MAFWVCYDHLGKLVVVNVLGALALAAPAAMFYTAVATGHLASILWIGLPSLYLLGFVVMPVLTAGAAAMTKQFLDTRDGELRTFFAGMRRHGARALGAGAILAAVHLSLGTALAFYLGPVGAKWPLFGYTLAALTLWLWLYVLLLGLFAVPALVQKQAGVLKSLRLAAMLVLDNIFASLCYGLAVLVIAAFAAMPLLYLAFSWAPAAVLTMCGYEMFARRYARLEAAAAGDPAGWRDEEDDYLNRGLRDLLFPWKG